LSVGATQQPADRPASFAPLVGGLVILRGQPRAPFPVRATKFIDECIIHIRMIDRKHRDDRCFP
jgi:hypothetical protein